MKLSSWRIKTTAMKILSFRRRKRNSSSSTLRRLSMKQRSARQIQSPLRKQQFKVLEEDMVLSLKGRAGSGQATWQPMSGQFNCLHTSPSARENCSTHKIGLDLHGDISSYPEL